MIIFEVRGPFVVKLPFPAPDAKARVESHAHEVEIEGVGILPAGWGVDLIAMSEGWQDRQEVRRRRLESIGVKEIFE